MKVSVLIVSWNVKEHLLDCIRSIKKQVFSYDYEIIVTDNASSDGTVESLKREFPDVHVIASDVNLGFGAGNNRAARHAKGEYLFILNPDSSLPINALQQFVEFMDNNEAVALCGPKVLNEDGSLQRSVRLFQTWGAALHKYTVFSYFGLFKKAANEYRCKGFDYSSMADVEQLIGAALFIRREIFEQHKGFDELFFMYYEEVDLCFRIKEAGQRIVYFPGAEVIHLGGKSSDQVAAKKQFMVLQSLVRYLRKHTSSLFAPFMMLLFQVAVLAKVVLDILWKGLSWLIFGWLLKERKREKLKRQFRENLSFLAKYSVQFLRA